ncbi:hypothetical protein Micbo1qcDRAFT_27138 [Microdochium bolleyi]|uniref:Uncharacterized protein n=1 Tax=Microdochium bolleyi TaxID=196109 RepID=A0A136JEE8_9PEZI|nr:hypothetical protein Micbo1qcDRAFT_27138 [Microdochium bolleyi]
MTAFFVLLFREKLGYGFGVHAHARAISALMSWFGSCLGLLGYPSFCVLWSLLQIQRFPNVTFDDNFTFTIVLGMQVRCGHLLLDCGHSPDFLLH